MEAKREVAATGEQSPEVPPHWFLYLMERMDRMENNLRSEFRQELGGIRQEFNGLKQEVNDIRQEMHGIYRWSIGLLVTMLLGFGGIIATLAVTLR
ncbi:hypothetical protein [Desulfofundulus salinus]|uniref:DUF1640 domain-containing protein n=1 Tax=Desulfofundulus salinus TaxID=2419843 RepID=A0A494X5H2_9FIRM|nr:hypothetical protein [Desulfofundulus salinum]RKO68024.1 hypothetical protein D7024_01305 [Desulfofundulus salinum]